MYLEINLSIEWLIALAIAAYVLLGIPIARMFYRIVYRDSNDPGCAVFIGVASWFFWPLFITFNILYWVITVGNKCK